MKTDNVVAVSVPVSPGPQVTLAVIASTISAVGVMYVTATMLYESPGDPATYLDEAQVPRDVQRWLVARGVLVGLYLSVIFMAGGIWLMVEGHYPPGTALVSNPVEAAEAVDEYSHVSPSMVMAVAVWTLAVLMVTTFLAQYANNNVSLLATVSWVIMIVLGVFLVVAAGRHRPIKEIYLQFPQGRRITDLAVGGYTLTVVYELITSAVALHAYKHMLLGEFEYEGMLLGVHVGVLVVFFASRWYAIPRSSELFASP